MRKFKIRNLAARRMRGLDDTPPENRQEERPAAPEKEENAGRRLRVTSRTDVGLVRKNNQDVRHSLALRPCCICIEL